MKPIEEGDVLHTENAELEIKVVNPPAIEVEDQNGNTFAMTDHLIRKNREQGVWSIHDKRGIE